MSLLDIFNDDAFSTVEMTKAIDLVETQPSLVGGLGIFVDEPVRTETVAVEKRQGALSIIQTSQRGEPLETKRDDKRTIRDLRTSRIAKSVRIHASELQFIREMGEEQQIKSIQSEISRRLNGPMGLVSDVEATWENMRLGSIQSVVLDADGTEIYNFNDEFGTTLPTEIAFDLANTANGDLKKLITASVIRPMARAAKGLRYTGIIGLCGDDFFDDLLANAEYRAAHLNNENAIKLIDGTVQSVKAFGIQWINYVGTDDNSTIAVPTDKVKFIPAGASGAFSSVWSPGESFDDIGTLGTPLQVKIIRDMLRDAWVDLEVYSYPLMLNKRPEMAFSGRAGA